MAVDVLIVDDSVAKRKVLLRALKQAEVPLGEVHEAADGLEALEKLKTVKVALILAEINMPNMDGLELLSRLKAHPEWKDLPVIMVTTEGGQSKVMKAAQLGAAGYVRKPFSTEQIKLALSGLV
jgi:two-component system chemotaxis response regulator CheY